MRLTPADVHNVAFKKPSLGKRGYDEDEVDAFLDLVEAELSRLIEEINELNQQVAAGGVATDVPVEQEPQPTQDVPESESIPAASVVEHHDHEAVESPSLVKDDQPAAAPAPASIEPAPHHVQAARLLGLAQETAERLTGEAAAEAAETRSAARTAADKLVGDAQSEADRLTSEAQNRAETLERDSQARAEALDSEAKAKYTQVLGQLSEERTALEKKIDDLRFYEREYRTRLKSWITDQLAQLDENGAPTDGQLAEQSAE